VRELSGALDDVATAINGVTASTVTPSVDTVPLEHALALVNKIKAGLAEIGTVSAAVLARLQAGGGVRRAVDGEHSDYGNY
jgi:hypothetical protein